MHPTGKALTAIMILESAELRKHPEFSACMFLSAMLAMNETDMAILRAYMEHGTLISMDEPFAILAAA